LKSASLQYANALADIAFEQGAAAAAGKQLNDFAAAYESSAELRNFLASPAVTREEKHAVILKIAERLGSGKILRNFLLVMIDHQRTHLLPEIAETLQEVIRQRQGIVEAEIRSAVELSEAQRRRLAQKLELMTGKKIEPRYSLDPALLGGAVVRIGSTIYDGSLRNRLDTLRARLTSEQ
jgi:F-type H+-transporting ATPase subunit delta